ncbi:MAG: 50S ribosomal protein L39e [Promethearchaeota archaeon]
MARNKDLASKVRRGKRAKQGQSLPNWIAIKTNRKVTTSPYSRKSWRNTRLKRD